MKNEGRKIGASKKAASLPAQNISHQSSNNNNNNINVNINTAASETSKKSTFFRYLQHVVTPIIVAMIGCIGYIVSARNDLPVSVTPIPSAPTNHLIAQASSSPAPLTAQTAGVFELDDPDNIFNPVTFCLTSRDTIGTEDFQETLRIIRTRLDAMKSPYAIQTGEKAIWITATRSAFGKNEIEVQFTKYILAYPGGTSVGSKRFGEQTIDSSDIQSHRIYKVLSAENSAQQGYGLELTLAPSGTKKLIEIGKDMQANGGGTIGLGAVAFEPQYTHAVVTGADVQLSFGCEQESIINLVAEVVTGQPLPLAYLVDGQDTPLLFYKETEQLPENRVCFSLVKDFQSEDEMNEFSANTNENIICAIRYRMSALGNPFFVRVNNNEIIVETLPNHIGYEVIRLLRKKRTVELYPAIGPKLLDEKSIDSVYATYDGFKLSLTNDGWDQLLLSAYENSNQSSDYYLSVNGVLVSRITLSLSKLKTIMEDTYFRELVFSKLLIHEQPEINDNNFFIMELSNAIFYEDYQLPCDLVLNRLWSTEEKNGIGENALGQKRTKFPECQMIKKAILAVVPDAVVSQAIESNTLYIGLPIKIGTQLPVQFINTMLHVLESVKFEQYLFQDIIFYIAGIDSQNVKIECLFTKTAEPEALRSVGPYETGDIYDQYESELYELFMEKMNQYVYSFMI